MRPPIFAHIAIAVCLAALSFETPAQRKPPVKRTIAVRPREVGSTGVVLDETLAVLREKPGLSGIPIQRMRRGRNVRILGVAEVEGVKFFRVAAMPSNVGWVQADAIYGKFREGDDERLARLVQSMNGFDQIEAATEFFTLFPSSPLRSPLLLLYGDLLEDTAVKLSRDATNRLSRTEMAASGAPLHTYYLNFVSLDRYRKLGVVFLFNPANKQYHYDGASWAEILEKDPASKEAGEARKRLDSLKMKMMPQNAKQ